MLGQSGKFYVVTFQKCNITFCVCINEDWGLNPICVACSYGTYTTISFDVNTSSFLNKVFHYVKMAFTSCQVQWSHLMERKKKFSTMYTNCNINQQTRQDIRCENLINACKIVWIPDRDKCCRWRLEVIRQSITTFAKYTSHSTLASTESDDWIFIVACSYGAYTLNVNVMLNLIVKFSSNLASLENTFAKMG